MASGQVKDNKGINLQRVDIFWTLEKQTVNRQTGHLTQQSVKLSLQLRQDQLPRFNNTSGNSTTVSCVEVQKLTVTVSKKSKNDLCNLVSYEKRKSCRAN